MAIRIPTPTPDLDSVPKVCVLFVEKKADLNAKWSGGLPPLFLAASRGSVETCAMLLKIGADPNFKDTYGRTPLEAPIMAPAPKPKSSRVTETCALLVEKSAYLNIKGSSGLPPLFLAASDGNAEICALLLKRSADPSFEMTNSRRGEIAYTAAFGAGHLEIRVLLRKRGYKLDFCFAKKIS